ncbi:hypothetical protein G6F68_021253 [Rhizopus microsporus]|nr:hypothetical protein G6F68_021253 [Rhizopus microsporus]
MELSSAAFWIAAFVAAGATEESDHDRLGRRDHHAYCADPGGGQVAAAAVSEADRRAAPGLHRRDAAVAGRRRRRRGQDAR